MKIFCVDGGSGLSAGGAGQWYLLSDSMLLKSDNPMFVPDFDSDFRIFPAAAFLIERLGKSIARRFARRYYSQATLAAPVAACGMLRGLREKGEFPTPALAFDRSLLLGEFVELRDSASMWVQGSCGDETFELDLRGAMESADEAIEKISRYNTLKTGDIIIPCIAGEGIKIEPGKTLTADYDGGRMLEIRFK